MLCLKITHLLIISLPNSELLSSLLLNLMLIVCFHLYSVKNHLPYPRFDMYAFVLSICALDFLQAELGHRPSHVWRSIQAGVVVLKQGLVKQIGTGEETSIWADIWFLRDLKLKIVCPKSSNPPVIVVSIVAQWDFWAWHYEKNGLFSVVPLIACSLKLSAKGRHS